ncbi:hypothetical protein [Hoyosella altamirensis]|uniref:Uncharacterized protein n=1 Tax=Hoyosella altamirensis TaxID=616997 RepID=A0A839RTG9_9ACTN|nr:hypothetical protein [Hoyosella altamirensis]MBB3040175.1 hypothetical protein [Hoyosella altamirensis]
MTNTPEPPAEGQDFAAVLLQHAKGRAHVEISRLMSEVIEAVTETGKPGSVAITLTFTPDKDQPNLIKIQDKVAHKKPVEPRRSVWFADDDNSLHRNDPHQASLFGGSDTAVIVHHAHDQLS